MSARCVMCIAASLLAALVLFGCSGLEVASPAATGDRSRGRIVSVADGDTVTVRLDPGLTRSVRLLAIDSPEKYATRYGSPDECGSRAASVFMEAFEGDRVVLVADPTQDDVDRYGRLLRYVQLPAGKDLGAAEVARGLAMPYAFDSPARRFRHYSALARAARAASRGSWGRPCAGDFHSSVPGVQNGLRARPATLSTTRRLSAAEPCSPSASRKELHNMDTSCELPRDDSSLSTDTSKSASPVVVVSSLGDVVGSRAAAAALACAAVDEAEASLFVDFGGTAPRPTLLSTKAAKALEERVLGSVPHSAIAVRGGFCQIAPPADTAGIATAAIAVDAAGHSPVVIHASSDQLLRLVDGPLASRISAALLRGEAGADPVLAAPVASELLSRGLTITLLDRRLGWVTERRALFGALRAKDLHELPRVITQWFADSAARPLAAPSAS